MPTSVPVTHAYKDIFGITIHTYNNLSLMNHFSGAPLNDAIAAILTTDLFVSKGFNVTKVQVTGAKWINYNGNVALTYNLTTVSDPVSAADIIVIIAGVVLIFGTSLIVTGIVSALATGGIVLPASVLAIITGASFIAGLILVIAGAWSIIQGSGGVAGLLTGNTSGILNDVVAIAALGLVGVGLVLYFTRK